MDLSTSSFTRDMYQRQEELKRERNKVSLADVDLTSPKLSKSKQPNLK